MPVPSAVIIVAISCDESILSKRAFSTFRILPRSGRIAWTRRSRPCFAEPPAESPSTMKSSDSFGSRDWQSASLPGSEAPSSAPLRRTVSRALRAAMRARAASATFAQIRFATFGFSSRKAPSLSLSIVSTMDFASVFESFVLVWPSKLAPGSRMRHDRREPLAHVVAGRELLLQVLEEVRSSPVGVDGAGEGGLEADEVGAALVVVDVVREGEDLLVVAVVPLQGDLDEGGAALGLDLLAQRDGRVEEHLARSC